MFLSSETKLQATAVDSLLAKKGIGNLSGMSGVGYVFPCFRALIRLFYVGVCVYNSAGNKEKIEVLLPFH